MRTIQTVYRAIGAGPYSNYVGFANSSDVGDGDLLARRAPVEERTYAKQGALFRWHADTFDTHARPTSVSRYDSRNNVRTETIVYSDNAVKWVLRQIASVTESSSGAVMVANHRGAGNQPQGGGFNRYAYTDNNPYKYVLMAVSFNSLLGSVSALRLMWARSTS